MRILIVYYLWHKNDRNTMNEHLLSFKKYSDEECYYLNTAYGIPRYVTRINFDLVVYHYTFLASLRWGNTEWHRLLRGNKHEELKGYKVAIPQDEYYYSDRLNEFFMRSGVKSVFTCLPESEWQKVYSSEKSGLERYVTVFTGYVDELALDRLATSTQSHRSRPIDIGYRARKNPYWLGRHGMIKWRLTEEFLNAPVKYNFKLDLSNDPKDVFYGDKWYGFLSKCRVVLGCESGASLHDPDGSIMEKVNRYAEEHPAASFEEVEAACFPGLEGNLHLFVLSPRHFEAVVTRTCQALVEGEYGGIFKPGVHYIEIKKDWSNIREVMRQIEDVDYCERIADNAYRGIAQSGLYTYRRFVQQVLEHVRHVQQPVSFDGNDDALYLRQLQLRNKYPFAFSPFTFVICHIFDMGYKMLIKLGLYDECIRFQYKVHRALRKVKLLRPKA